MAPHPPRLLFVCTGNICRSLMAERLARDLAARRGLTVEARSCGVAAQGYYQVPAEIWRALKEAGVDPAPHRPQLVSRELLAWADRVLVMTGRHRELLNDRFPEFRKKTDLLLYKGGVPADIADPMGQGWAVYQACRREISEALERVLTPVP